MRLIDADALCEALLERWNTADQNAEEIISELMAKVVTPIVVGMPTIEPSKSTDQNVADVPSGDLISRADVIEAVTRLCVDGYKAKVDGYFIPLTDALINTLSALPSADRPTVIRSKTLMPTKDFKEWAKRIREVNPNAVVIPCDAEVVSAEPYREESEAEE